MYLVSQEYKSFQLDCSNQLDDEQWNDSGMCLLAYLWLLINNAILKIKFKDMK